MDFGLAQLTDAVPDVTMVPVGTLRYMAPEQLEDLPPTAQTDVRSLGLILYEMLTGSSAISARTIRNVADEILNRDISLAPIDVTDKQRPSATDSADDDEITQWTSVKSASGETRHKSAHHPGQSQ